jgi:hypothetical protein
MTLPGGSKRARGPHRARQSKDSVLGGSFKSRMQGIMNELLPETFEAKQGGGVSV